MSALDTRFSYAAGFVKSTTQQHASTGRVSARQNEPFNKNPPFRCTGFGRSGTSSNRRRSSSKNASHRDVKKQPKIPAFCPDQSRVASIASASHFADLSHTDATTTEARMT
ncbi:uncharacterized protein LOC121594049 isoform X1 [Anopheles merus]|uniref:uncharacterized protein LOC121594049 isoform X1 n=1 Tax=Anopheles merus TaxID=30066 RepID=UPI001BE449A2|nr:uncharacterized protein LOC121594049 isoform X1 [Anopheles merus]